MLKIKKLRPDARIVTKAHQTDLGYDLYCCDDFSLQYGQKTIVDTGIAVGFPPGWGGLIKDRSSMAAQGIMTSGGVIDETYTGEIRVILTQTASRLCQARSHFPAGSKIAQLVLVPTTNFPIVEVEELTVGERGEKGFGSSGAF